MAAHRTDDRTLVAGRYARGERLGHGGFGVVWRGHDTLLQRDVAVKEIQFPASLDEDEQARLREKVLREARAAARMSHPGLVTVFDVVEEDGRPLIVMELVDAPTLSEHILRNGPLDDRQAAEIGCQILDALSVAHEHGIVHRDVKPANVMVHQSGRVQLADFGVASMLDDPKVTSSGNLAGSPAYMAPEQANNRPASPATDLWGLGATLYFAMEGLPPFDKGEALATLTSVVNDPPRPMRRAGAMGPLVEQLLAKDPAFRPQVEEVRRRLSDIAEPSTDPDPTERFELNLPVATAHEPARAPVAEPILPEPQPEPEPAATEHDPPAAEAAAWPEAAATPEVAARPDAAAEPEAEAAPWPEAAAAPEAAPWPDADSFDDSEPIETHEAVVTPEPPPAEAAPPPEPEPQPVRARAVPEPQSSPAPAPAPAWVSPPPATAGAARPRPARRAATARRRSAAPLVALVVVLALVGGLVAFLATRDTDSGGDTGASPSDSTTATTEAEAKVPSGWTRYRDPDTGFTIAHPPGWTVQRNGTLTEFRDPATRAYLRVDHQQPAGPSAEGAWYDLEPRFAAQYANYQRLQITPTTYKGFKAALWEFLYTDGGADLHAVDLGFITPKYGFALNFQTRAGDWDRLKPTFEQFKEAFKAPT